MDLEYIRRNFTGSYIAQKNLGSVLDYVQKDPGYTDGERALLANGMMKLKLSISPDFEFQLTDNNEKTIRFHNNILHDGFWFTDFKCQSIARYENDCLIIEMRPPLPESRKAIYQFYEKNGMKSIAFKMFNGTKWWTMTYEKFA